MGAHLETAVVEFKEATEVTRAVAEREWDRIWRDEREYSGSDPYSGTLATVTGVVLRPERFDRINEARRWLYEQDEKGLIEKWGPAWAVRVGKYHLVFAGLCAC